MPCQLCGEGSNGNRHCAVCRKIVSRDDGDRNTAYRPVEERDRDE